MFSVSSFETHHIQPVIALWRNLHPDWTWLDDEEVSAGFLKPNVQGERIRYVIENDDGIVASVFGIYPIDTDGPRNRSIQIESSPENIAAVWLEPVLISLADADRDCPDSWQIAQPSKALWPALVPILEAAGFSHRSSGMRMEWTGDSVFVPDTDAARLERYAGGNPEIDQAIVDLHNRSYRASRLVSPVNLEQFWQTWPGITQREYVVALEQDRVVGYAEWFVSDGKPFINSFVAARSHWGTPVGAAVGTKAMEILVGLGYRTIESSVNSKNAASMKLHLKHGWRVAEEHSRIYIRAL